MKNNKIPLFSIVLFLVAFLGSSSLPVNAKTSDNSPFTFYPIDKERVFVSQYMSKAHMGIDLAPKIKGEKLEIHAAGDGVVVYAGTCTQGWCKRHGGTVIIKHANGERTLYAHLRSIQVTEGETVKAGQLLGSMSDSGITSGPILHFEICKTYCSSQNVKTRINPLKYFAFQIFTGQVTKKKR